MEFGIGVNTGDGLLLSARLREFPGISQPCGTLDYLRAATIVESGARRVSERHPREEREEAAGLFVSLRPLGCPSWQSLDRHLQRTPPDHSAHLTPPGGLPGKGHLSPFFPLHSFTLCRDHHCGHVLVKDGDNTEQHW